MNPLEHSLKPFICDTDNSTQHGDRYLRQCESAAAAQKLVQQKFTVHGHTEVALADVVCDYDGSYGPYEVQEGM